jgi:hypothetical protein
MSFLKLVNKARERRNSFSILQYLTNFLYILHFLDSVAVEGCCGIMLKVALNNIKQTKTNAVYILKLIKACQ